MEQEIYLICPDVKFILFYVAIATWEAKGYASNGN